MSFKVWRSIAIGLILLTECVPHNPEGSTSQECSGGSPVLGYHYEDQPNPRLVRNDLTYAHGRGNMESFSHGEFITYIQTQSSQNFLIDLDRKLQPDEWIQATTQGDFFRLHAYLQLNTSQVLVDQEVEIGGQTTVAPQEYCMDSGSLLYSRPRQKER